MEEEIARFNTGRRRAPHVEDRRLTDRIYYLRKHIDLAKEQGDLTQANAMKAEIKRLDQARKGLSSVDPWDAHFRRLVYCRYADDIALGVIGSKADAKGVLEKVGDFLQSALRLDLSQEKSGITHARRGMTCLGYTVQTYSRPKIVRTKRAKTRYTTQKAISEQVVLGIPGHKIAPSRRRSKPRSHGRSRARKVVSGLKSPRFCAFVGHVCPCPHLYEQPLSSLVRHRR